MGTSTYVELVNQQYGLYNRSGTQLAAGDLSSLTQTGGLALTDPQVIWDPTTSRFYYSVLAVDDAALTSELAFGFSLGPSPTSASSFCSYTFGFYGHTLGDEPKLGDFSGFVLVGVNDFPFSGGNPTSLVNWISKPAAALSSCPAQSSFSTGALPTLNGNTPVPANEADNAQPFGYVLTTPINLMTRTGNSFTLYQISAGGSGGIQVASQATIPLTESYSVPPDAPQPGGNYPLDTRDGDLLNAVYSYDPSQGIAAIWTQHTVATGDGKRSRVKWYELNPGLATVIQHGDITDPNLWVFNGAISSDRAVNGSQMSYGQDMALGVNTSSSTSYEAIKLVHKDGPEPPSGMQLVKQSTATSTDLCFTPAIPNACRWGDYAGASPDPLGVEGSQAGSVWFTSSWVGAPNGTDWYTWNWQAQTTAKGAVLRSFTPSPSGNGRAVAVNTATNQLYYTLYPSTAIYVTTTSGGAVTTLAVGIQCGALAWDPTRSVLWCGAYDGSGHVFTVDPATGTATLQFTFVFASTENCFGQPPGNIDGLSFDSSDGTLWLGDDGAKVFHHVDVRGNVLASWTVPESLCNSGISVDTTSSSNLLWLAVFTSPSPSSGYFMAVSKTNPELVEGSVPYGGSGVPEGIAFDPGTFQPKCALWSNSASSTSDDIVATNVAPYCP